MPTCVVITASETSAAGSNKRGFVGLPRPAGELSFSEGDCTILLAQTATVHRDPDLLLSVAAFTIIDYAKYSYAQK